MEFKLQTFGMIKNTRVKIEDYDKCTLFTSDDSTSLFSEPDRTGRSDRENWEPG